MDLDRHRVALCQLPGQRPDPYHFDPGTGQAFRRCPGMPETKFPAFGCSELFTYGEYVLFEGKGKMTVDNCDVRERFYPLREDVGRFAAGAYMLSVADAITALGQPNEGLFGLLYYALSYAAYKEQNPTDLAICFLARCLALQGYAPRLTHCARCGQDLRHLNQLSFSPGPAGGVHGLPGRG